MGTWLEKNSHKDEHTAVEMKNPWVLKIKLRIEASQGPKMQFMDLC